MTNNTKINNILALTSHGGGYLNHNKKNYSERRNHGLSLTNLTHCISPSEYYNDYYNNDSFNKINLQLHASSNKVSNPYSFSIKSNTSFSGDVQADLPLTSTEMWSYAINEDEYVKDFTLTIPPGVTILNLQADGNAIDTQITEIIIKNKDSGKIWLHNGSFNQDESYEENKYIGVTPDKTYNLNLTITHGGDGEGGSQNNGAFYYSSEINTHTPDIEDY